MKFNLINSLEVFNNIIINIEKRNSSTKVDLINFYLFILGYCTVVSCISQNISKMNAFGIATAP